MFRLSDNCSVFMAEVYAIHKAVDEIISRKLDYVNLISDSRSALMALDSLKEKRVIINEIKKKINAYKGKINLKWVRAHKGTTGNERADCLGKTACEKQTIDVYFHVTKSEIKLDGKRKAIGLWHDRWSSSKNGKTTRKFFGKVCLKRVKGDFYINQIYTGHGIFRT
ncbi:hypothetical protein AVEN_84232-1 [Araneus ventricosus]|uniref:RNase H type-1 domain-containing protein n=1 Tax=Araneus ventricosus TaxID=182803 RepID=A0A4Y2L1C7_ARAVE|nr:hypothetical protein AVEN_84232-1 [Araneus ventricosus]